MRGGYGQSRPPVPCPRPPPSTPNQPTNQPTNQRPSNQVETFGAGSDEVTAAREEGVAFAEEHDLDKGLTAFTDHLPDEL